MTSEELNKIGVDLGKENKTKEAVKYFKKALKKDSTNLTALTNLAFAYKNIGETKKSIVAYQNALILDAGRAATYDGLASVYYEIENFKEASKLYKKAIKLEPDNANYYCNLGTTYADLGKYKLAVENLKKAIGLNPNLAEAYYNLGFVFENNNDYREAIFFFGETLKTKPEIPLIYPHLYFMFRHICDWKFLKQFERKISELNTDAIHSNEVSPETPFINFCRSEDVEDNLKIAKSWQKKYPNKKLKLLKNKNKKIRVGYVSDAFYNFPTAHNITDVIKKHDKERFQIFIYSHGPDDKSIYRKEIKKAVHKFRDIKNLSDIQAAEKIKKDKIDLLIDLKGYMRGNRLGIFALRPAPVQASWIGYPATTGVNFIDYIIADKTVIPTKHKKYYSEKVVYLSNCYRTPDTISPIAKSFKNKKSLEKIFKNKFVFSSFNSAYKITPEIFDVWMNILKAVPNSVLWILIKNEMARKNILLEVKKRGVKKSRIIFTDKLEKDKHLARIAMSDLALDTLPVNGHTTTTDCLRMNVPVVTTLGKHFASRVSASCLKTVGLSDLVARDLEEYEKIAIKLATNSKKLEAIKNILIKNKNNLFDIKQFTKYLERIYDEIALYNY